MKTNLTSAIIALALFAGVSQAAAQNATVTYQGRVLANGASFNGTGQFKFALVTSANISSPAYATAQLTGSVVTSVTVDVGGNGYTSPPAVSFSGGGGSGAAATATVSGGAMTDITVNNAGSGYTNAPTVTIAPPPETLSFDTYWSNDGTSVSGSEPAAAVSADVTDGLFTVVLGDTRVANMAAIDASVFVQPSLQLRIWFNDGVHGSAALSRVQNLTSTPYAIQALNANSANNLSGFLPAAQLTSIGNTNGGYANFFVGFSGNSTMSGSLNTAIGEFTLNRNTSGDFNTADGYSALYANTTGHDNTAVGAYALSVNMSGSYNTAIGHESLNSNTNGTYNTANGALALSSNTSGSNNTALGYLALPRLTSGSGNIAIGPSAGASIVTGNNNIDIGNPGSNDESDTIRIGTSQTKAVMLGIYPTTITSSAGLVCVNPSGLLGTGSAGGAFLGSDLQIGTDAGEYHHLRLSGGNSWGYLYGSFPGLGDGIHLGYNYYWDANGGGKIINGGGGTSRISAGYGRIVLSTGDVNVQPYYENLVVSGLGGQSVTVNGTFNDNSDRNAKQDFSPVSPLQILDKVTQLPLSEWSYKMDPETRHIGPVAQDFSSTFNLGTDDKHISPMDEGGVALAAIQGLSQKLKEKDMQIQSLEKELREIQAVVRKLAAQK